MAVVPERTSKKLIFWLWTVLDTRHTYETLEKKTLQ